ncbi:MAG: hypothetical protein H6909_00790 [Rickettsiaceae bacterium]|nr:hypothetical protein [Rickettsiaceae bacterium]
MPKKSDISQPCSQLGAQSIKLKPEKTIQKTYKLCTNPYKFLPQNNVNITTSPQHHLLLSIYKKVSISDRNEYKKLAIKNLYNKQYVLDQLSLNIAELTLDDNNQLLVGDTMVTTTDNLELTDNYFQK